MKEEGQRHAIYLIQLHSKCQQDFLNKLTKLSSEQVGQLFQNFQNSLKQDRKSKAKAMMQLWTNVSKNYPIDANKYNFDETMMQNLCKHIRVGTSIDEAVLLIQQLYINKDYTSFANQKIFCVFIQKFLDTKDDNKAVLTEVILQMTSANKKLIPLISNPYHFLQYFIHLINQQQNDDKLGFWIKKVKQLYWYAPSQQCLFHSSDFLALIDILFSVIENSNQVSLIRICLECYLVLSCCDKIVVKGVFYRLQDLKNKLSVTNLQGTGLMQLAAEICCIDENK